MLFSIEIFPAVCGIKNTCLFLPPKKCVNDDITVLAYALSLLLVGKDTSCSVPLPSGQWKGLYHVEGEGESH